MNRKSRQGFTLLEVMVSIGIITGGAVGILAMQDAALVANRASRRATVANNYMHTWIRRIKVDAYNWNTAGQGNLTNTDYLTELSAENDTTGWMRFNPDGDNSYYADWLGEDTETAAEASYCTHVKLSWVRIGSSIRADIRTFWTRERVRSSTAAKNFVATCTSADPDTIDFSTLPAMRVAYASTVVRWTPRE